MGQLGRILASGPSFVKAEVLKAVDTDSERSELMLSVCGNCPGLPTHLAMQMVGPSVVSIVSISVRSQTLVGFVPGGCLEGNKELP